MLEGKRVLRQAFKDLERELPQRVALGMRGLRHPKARYIRIPVAVLSIVGGVFSFLPVLGLWMLPLGLLLLAHDVPFANPSDASPVGARKDGRSSAGPAYLMRRGASWTDQICRPHL